MGSVVTLSWKPLVELIRRGEFEPKGPDEVPRFLYCRRRHRFVSDPGLIEDIRRARSHRHPFMLVGRMGTGKNIVLELIVQKELTADPTECIDENVEGPYEQEMLEKFFGKNGLVESHPHALIHFDLLENAASWPTFLDKLHELARAGTLYRTDGKIVKGLGVRVVGGATVDLRNNVAEKPSSSLAYIYNYLTENQLIETKPLTTRAAELETLLAELLAVQVTDPDRGASAAEVERLGHITSAELDVLRKYTWPGQFGELVKLVNDAVALGSWQRAIATNIPCRVFIIWSRYNKEQARALNTMLTAAQIPTFFSPISMGPGKWWSQIRHHIDATDFVIVCVTREVFEPDAEGVNLREARLAIERAENMRRPFILPVSLDGSRPSDLATVPHDDLVMFLKAMNWYWVTPKGEGIPKLLEALRRECATLRAAQVRRRN